MDCLCQQVVTADSNLLRLGGRKLPRHDIITRMKDGKSEKTWREMKPSALGRGWAGWRSQKTQEFETGTVVMACY